MKDTSGQSNHATQKKARYEPNLLLRHERELKGWSQAHLAEQLDAQTNLVTRWEKGYAFPSPHYRQCLCQIFEKNAEELGLLKPVYATPGTPDPIPQDEVIERLEKADELEKEYACDEISDVEEVEEVSTKGNDLTQLKQQDRKKHKYGRRTLLLGLAGGVIAAGISGAAQRNAGPQVKISVFAQGPQPNIISTEYIYHTPTAKDVNYVSWSPRGHFIACANGDDTVQVLDAHQGNVLLTYPGHSYYANCASWSPDEKYIASASADKTVHVWEAQTARRKLVYQGHSTAVLSVSWSPDGAWIASSGKDGRVHIWNAFTGKVLHIYQAHKHYIWTVSWSNDSQYVASCGDDGIIQVWYPSTGKKDEEFVYAGPTDFTVNQVIWSPDGSRLVSAHDNASAYIWDSLTGRKMITYPRHTAAVITARWSPNAQYIASGGLDRTIQIWNGVTGEHVLTYNKHTAEIYEVSWSPDGTRLASASADHTMHVCRVSFA